MQESSKENKRLICCAYNSPPCISVLPTPQKENHFSGKIFLKALGIKSCFSYLKKVMCANSKILRVSSN